MNTDHHYLVFGKSGQVATALAQLASSHHARLTFIDRSAIDLETLDTPDLVMRLIDQHQPHAILNAAAYTAVDKAEGEPEIAQKVNATAPDMMARACAHKDIPLVHVSTDFVFDGRASTPYLEDAPTQPISVYGKTKLAGERAITQSQCTYVILRTAWVFSNTGNNFVKTMLRLGAERDELTIVADQQGGPTPANAIANAMLLIADALIDAPEKSGIYHFSGQPKTSWADFARAIFSQAQLTTHVIDIPTSDYPTPAARPAWSVLNCQKIEKVFNIRTPSWHEALRETIHALKNNEKNRR